MHGVRTTNVVRPAYLVVVYTPLDCEAASLAATGRGSGGQQVHYNDGAGYKLYNLR